MSQPVSSAASYDEIPFPTQSVAQTHPAHLAAVARLFGLRAAPADRCRVLELGSATGGNLLPMAERHPQGTFVGIDYSARQVEVARQTAAALKLTNVELRHQSILELDESLGQFDYIICHGVLSWVPPQVRQKIFELCRTCLLPQGVAFLSYNTYPGWHLRGMMRELLMSGVPADLPPTQRVSQGRRVLEFFATTFANDRSPYARAMQEELHRTLGQPDNYLFHEPFYFHDFAEQAAEHQLQYLGDALPETMFPAVFGPRIEQNLLALGGDTLVCEQHMDLLRNRAFRQSLVCHRAVPLIRRIAASALDDLAFISRLRPEHEPIDVQSNTPVKFSLPTGQSLTTPSPVLKAALSHLGGLWPRAVAFPALLRQCETLLDRTLEQRDRDELALNLIEGLANGLVEFQTGEDTFVVELNDKPCASHLARLQAMQSNRVTNQRHAIVVLDEASQHILPMLDGKNDRAALMHSLQNAVKKGDLSILVNHKPATAEQQTIELLSQTLDQSLGRLARHALLIG